MDKNALYYEENYVKECSAEVVICRASEDREKGAYVLEFDRHLFYPEGGGQKADRGFVYEEEGWSPDRKPLAEVLSVEETDLFREDGAPLFLHYTDQPVPVGTRVHLVVDWEKRMINTRNHSGDHLVSGIIFQKFGCHNVGFHMSEVMTIDFDGVLKPEDLLEVEMEANAAVMRDLPVKSFWPSESELAVLPYRSKKKLSGDVRLVDLGGMDLCACCGTHVHRTGEIGPIKILSSIGRKGGTRIEMFCGSEAFSDYQKKHQLLQEISRMLNVSIPDTVEALSKYMEESREKDLRISKLNQRYYEKKAESLENTSEMIVDFEEGMNPVELRKCCDYFMKHTAAPLVGVFCERKEGGYSYVIGSSRLDVSSEAGAFNRAVNGRGGGQKEMIQGSLRAEPEKISEAMKLFF